MAVDFWAPGSIHGDEYYTLLQDAEVIADHLLKLPLKVWCPFNDSGSVWPEVLRRRGFEVVTTETDFFATEPPEGVQCIISNDRLKWDFDEEYAESIVNDATSFCADMVEVVRCKDCKHFGESFSGTHSCKLHKGLVGTKYDTFCSYGERKDNG